MALDRYYEPITYTATCPGGTHDALWTAKCVDGLEDGQWCYMTKIISIKCEVCE